MKSDRARDGIRCEETGSCRIQTCHRNASASCKPSVIRDRNFGLYRMWSCGSGANIAATVPFDRMGSPGARFGRTVESVSRQTWDSEMIECRCVFHHAGERFPLHAVDGYGRDDLGWQPGRTNRSIAQGPLTETLR